MIDFTKDVRLSFLQIAQKYNLTIQQVKEQYESWRANR